jgi:hypothetical protein
MNACDSEFEQLYSRFTARFAGEETLESQIRRIVRDELSSQGVANPGMPMNPAENSDA